VAASGSGSATLFGTSRELDFSQLEPRGHYADSETLRHYFRAMMWLGRVDLRLIETDASSGEGRFQPRQLRAALALRALMLDGKLWSAKLAVAIQLQIASLQRTQHVLSLHRDHVADGWWIHPGHIEATKRKATRIYRTKRGRELAVPLVGLVREKVEQALAMSDGDFPFGTGRTGLPERRYRPDFMKELRQRAKLDGATWRPHDCRKLGATALDRLGVKLDEYQRVLSHSRPRSVTTTAYLLPELLDPVLATVLEKWSAHLMPLVSVAPSAATSQR
jgi:hypothetical protein